MTMVDQPYFVIYTPTDGAPPYQQKMLSEADAQEMVRFAKDTYNMDARVELALVCDCCSTSFPESECHVTEDGDKLCAECAQMADDPEEEGLPD